MISSLLTRLAIATIGLTVSLASIAFRAEPAFSVNLVRNGGFESPVVPDSSYELFKSIDGWTQINGILEIQRNVAGTPFEGEQHAELDNNEFFQDIMTQVGQKYVLSFYVSPRPFTSAQSNTFSVLFGNTFSQSFELGSGSEQTSWAKFSTEVVADSDLTRLQFNYTGELEPPEIALGVYLDDVRLEARSAAVPEPTSVISLVMFGFWQFSLMQQRKRQG